MASLQAYLKPNKERKDGKSPIFIRITVNRKSRIVSTGEYVKPEQWDANLRKVKRNHPNSVLLNNKIADQIRQLESNSLNSKKSDNAKNIKDSLKQNNSNFFEIGQKFIDTKFETDSIGTARRYESVIKKLKEHHGSADLPILDMDLQYLEDYRAYLRRIGNIESTIHANLKALRAILNEAIRMGYLAPTDNPFFYFKMTSTKTAKHKLSINEIESIEALDLEDVPLMERVRDAFMFSFYCAGIRIGDLLQLTSKNVRDGRLEYKMGKTNQSKSILLLPPALNLLEIHQSDESEFLFKFLNEKKDLDNPKTMFTEISSKSALINKYLKRIAKVADLNITLSFHMSRHSFANYARKKGMSVYDISKALGHSSIQITERYLASFDEETLDEGMKKLFS